MDVTRRKQLQQELLKSQEQLQLFLDLAPAAISLKDLEGHVVWGNKTATTTFGTPGGTPDPANVDVDVESVDGVEHLKAMYSRVVRTGESVHDEIRFPSGVDDDRTFEVVKFPVTDAANHVYAVGTVGTDITERLRVDRALKESEARLRQLAESMDGVWVLWRADPPENLYVSASVERVLGIPAGTADFATILGAVHPDDQPWILQEIADPDNQDKQVDFRVIHGNGDTRWIRARTTKVADVDEGLRRSTILLDVTDEKLAVEALEEARAVAHRASLAKNDFLSRMSHELRTPLHAILGFGQLLAAESLTDRQHELTNQIGRAGGHLLRLIEEVLDISQIEGGSMRVNLEPLALSSVVTEALELVNSDARVARCPVRVVGDLSGIAVWADRTRLKQVLLNVLSNAIKYNRPGGEVVISVEADIESPVRLSVLDNGIGIAPEVMGRLFEPFDRLGAEHTLVPGTGLGLALAHQLMELMGGSIGAVSTVGSGTRFWLELAPAAGRVPVVEREGLRDLTANTKILEATTSLKFMYADDDELCRHFMARVFERYLPHAQLTLATGGVEALEQLRVHPPDILLLDIRLADMSGLDVMSIVREDPATANTPIILLSADSGGRHWKPTPLTHWLAKPFTVNEFLHLVASVT
jgi:PAS domain S-box-containing protein